MPQNPSILISIISHKYGFSNIKPCKNTKVGGLY
jgi:hypothetical protein